MPKDLLNISLSSNPNITYDIYKNNPEFKWDDYWLFLHIFKKDKELIYEKEYRKHMARYKINIWLCSILLSPHTKWGRKHIERKIEELYN